MVRERTLYSQDPISSPGDAVRLIADAIRDYDREVVAVINMQTDGKPININISSMGTINQSLVNPRELMKASILSNAASVIILHNHPSGSLSPSKEDITITDRLQQAYSLIGVDMLDHIIFDGQEHFYSFASAEILKRDDLHFSTDIHEVSERLGRKTSVIGELHEAKKRPQIRKAKEQDRPHGRDMGGMGREL